MTQEQKELLLKDLCGRLPYGVKVYDIKSGINSSFMNLNHVNGTVKEVFISYMHKCRTAPIEDIKPYLFPLSSMTEKQRNDISKLLIDIQNEFSPYGELNMKGCDNLFICTTKQSNAFINYCLTYHLDINGLIEKKLAIDATGKGIY